MIRAEDMLIARRADTRARADFATWKMMAKLNGASALPQQAHGFLESYQARLKEMAEPAAAEATLNLLYKAYYAEMGGVGAPPDLPAHSGDPVTDNVTAFKRPPRPTATQQQATRGPEAKSRLPVALIFACLVVVYVGIRYFWQ